MPPATSTSLSGSGTGGSGILTPAGSLRDPYDDLHLDRRIERQHGYADGRARVDAGVAEDLTEQLRSAVRDLRLAGEVGCGGHERNDLHDLHHAVEVADDRLHCGDRVERALLRARLRLLRADLPADLAGVHQLAVLH